eukprot:723942-Pelagomonas_calceolata.AAC.2
MKFVKQHGGRQARAHLALALQQLIKDALGSSALAALHDGHMVPCLFQGTLHGNVLPGQGHVLGLHIIQGAGGLKYKKGKLLMGHGEDNRVTRAASSTAIACLYSTHAFAQVSMLERLNECSRKQACAHLGAKDVTL